MALNVDKNRQIAGYTPTSTSQKTTARSTSSSQPIDFSSGNSSQNDGIYVIKKGDNLWNVAKQQLIAAGNPKPSNSQIMTAMQQIAEANGCSSVDECRIRFFNTIGAELNIQGLFGNQDSEVVEEPAVSTPAEEPVLSEQETKIKEELKTRFPDIKIENMTDSEVKTFLDNLKETNPELYAALESAVSAQSSEQVEATTQTGEVSEDAVLQTGLNEEQTQAIATQLNQYISEHPEVVTERQTNQAPTVQQSEIEQLAQKVGIEGNIDEIIRVLKGKETDLTADEKRLLALFDASNDNSSDITNLTDEQNMLAMVKRLIDSGFMDLTPDQQMTMAVDEFLTKNDKTYQNLATEEEKQAYLNKYIKDVREMAIPEDIDSGLRAQFAENMTSIRAMVLLQIAESQGMSLDDLKKLPEEDLHNILRQGENKAISMGFSLIKEQLGDKLENVSEEEKVNIYADAILNLLDSEYSSLSDDKKAAYRDQMIIQFAEKLQGDNSNLNIKDILNNPTRKKELYLNISYALEYIANAPDGDFISRIEQFNIKDMSSLCEVQKNEISERISKLEAKVKNGTATTKEIQDLKELRQINTKNENYGKMLDKFHKEGYTGNPTNAQALSIVEGLYEEAKRNGATEEELQDFADWIEELKKEIEINPDSANDICRPRLSIGDKAKVNDRDIAEEYSAIMGDLEPHSEEYNAKVKETIQEDIKNGRDITELFKFLRTQGYSEEEIEKIANESIGGNVYARIVSGDITAQQLQELQKTISASEDVELVAAEQRVGEKIYDKTFFDTWSEDDRTSTAAVMANDTRLQPAIQRGVIENSSNQEQAAERFSGITNSDELSDSGKATFNQTLITDTLTNDEDRLFYGRYISEHTNNAASLEGIAAASNSISDANIKNQYNSAVTTAASNLPPQQQNNVNNALTTGKISNETLSKTTPPSSSSSSGSSSSSNTNSSSNTSSRTQTSKTGVTSDNKPSQASTSTDTRTQSTTYNQSSSSSTYTNTEIVDAQRVASSEAKRQQAMDNALSTAQSIDEAVEDWNKKHAKKLSVEDIDTVKAAAAIEAAREAVESSTTSESEKERILSALSNATSISEVYNILVEALGASRVQDKFIEILATSGSSANIKAFVSSRAGESDSLIKQLFLRTSSKSLRKELLGMMSSDSIAELLANKQITDLTSVDQRVLISYVMKNIHLMSNTEFARFLNAIADPVEKTKLIELRSGVSQLKNNKPQSAPTAQDNTQDTPEVENPATMDAPTVQPAAQAFTTSENRTMPVFSAKTEQENEPSQAQPKLARGEMSRDMGDGTVLTRQGTGFGAISNTDFDITRVVQKPKSQEGAPIGMGDETLTVGSAEWNKKYNRNNVQTTAFTLASLEDEYGEEGFGGIWGGTSGNFKGKTPTKKLHKGGLRFNA